MVKVMDYWSSIISLCVCLCVSFSRSSLLQPSEGGALPRRPSLLQRAVRVWRKQWLLWRVEKVGKRGQSAPHRTLQQRLPQLNEGGGGPRRLMGERHLKVLQANRRENQRKVCDA